MNCIFLLLSITTTFLISKATCEELIIASGLSVNNDTNTNANAQAPLLPLFPGAGNGNGAMTPEMIARVNELIRRALRNERGGLKKMSLIEEPPVVVIAEAAAESTKSKSSKTGEIGTTLYKSMKGGAGESEKERKDRKKREKEERKEAERKERRERHQHHHSNTKPSKKSSSSSDDNSTRRKPRGTVRQQEIITINHTKPKPRFERDGSDEVIDVEGPVRRKPLFASS